MTNSERLNTAELFQFLTAHANNPPYIPERDDEPDIPAAHRMTLKGAIANALGEQTQGEGLLDRTTTAVAAALAELGYGSLLTERDELKERLLTALGNVAREAARAEQAESRLETVRQSARREEMTRQKRDAQIIILGDQLKKRGVTNAEISEWIESVS
ncbi:hypothetical protein ACH4GZ_38770 [Streptomyces hygroscopicus]|uniref:hypothetical protein n=1 Tax=Streptomyces hygroscopicus TaxID=1912 RepID=UPI00379B1736